ncbi:hypothetical protein BCR41DRAFT_391596 [Lobosporangium transversale]|uniref:Uncharacterized protein n=1 Tax=Lobosporangium transversale TaxID=64571 RepID=A0A1Y2H0Q8_9FUNG|nr:hypothetical protein BCR41DRAFT_391596 [Lobosporangium transversale]ORZ28128.1 hypothetical protein BCR41DRAFT_391596 [Lobosporangium transversale]|eukprot:XP_021885813.1 hypothetical protein BCR41DRAFT_391596 [Lobosporangium transversale]
MARWRVGLEAQKAALKWDDSSNTIGIKIEGGGSDNAIPQPRAQGSGNKSDSSKPHLQNLHRHDYDGGISFIHLASSSRPRSHRMIVEEESDEEADPYNPWTPPIYTGHELDFDTPAVDAPAAETPVIDSHIISETVDRNSNKGEGSKMTCIYSQL